jgi:transcriptional regulator with XRE-family HTH domain
MPPSDRRIDRGRRRAQQDRAAIGEELRRARLMRGWSLDEAGRQASMSGSQASRIERGLHRAVTHEQLVCLGAAVGLEIRIRAYPGAEGPLDRAQLRLLDRLRRLVPSTVEMRTEVALPDPTDQRAWDAVLTGLRESDGSSTRLMVEAETRLADVQAQLRRLALKARDGQAAAVLLVVADTRHNRAALDLAESTLDADFPVAARSALPALRAGRHPGGSAVIRL